jgi:hypothetical protein
MEKFKNMLVKYVANKDVGKMFEIEDRYNVYFLRIKSEEELLSIENFPNLYKIYIERINLTDIAIPNGIRELYIESCRGTLLIPDDTKYLTIRDSIITITNNNNNSVEEIVITYSKIDLLSISDNVKHVYISNSQIKKINYNNLIELLKLNNLTGVVNVPNIPSLKILQIRHCNFESVYLGPNLLELVCVNTNCDFLNFHNGINKVLIERH